MQTTTTSPFALADHVLILVLTYDWEWEEKKVIFIIQTKQIPLQVQLCKVLQKCLDGTATAHMVF